MSPPLESGQAHALVLTNPRCGQDASTKVLSDQDPVGWQHRGPVTGSRDLSAKGVKPHPDLTPARHTPAPGPFSLSPQPGTRCPQDPHSGLSNCPQVQVTPGPRRSRC